MCRIRPWWQVATLVAVLTAVGGCAARGPTPESSGSPTVDARDWPTVPADCDPSDARVAWSDLSEVPTLTIVSLLDSPRDGRQVLSTSVTPTIEGVRTPATWLPVLARSLRPAVQVVPWAPDSSALGGAVVSEADSAITESVYYSGVTRISAVFTVDCRPAVQGRLTSWIDSRTGMFWCGETEEPGDALKELARRYCPRTPGAPSSGAGVVGRN
jgi:hypothetical protein